jgi:MFS transporter, DHA2 family, multidrug resistance protein
LTRRLAVHRNDLMGNISIYNPEANERFFGLVGGFQSQGKSIDEAQKMATGVMEGIVSSQSAIISYAEGFLVVGIICAVCLPLVFFAKNKKGETVDVGSAH